MSQGLVLVLIPCGACGIDYLTEAVEGEHVCPDCGGITQLFEVEEEESDEHDQASR